MYPEIAAVFPDLPQRWKFAWRHLLRVVKHPFIPVQMAERIRLLRGVDFVGDCGRVRAPTLVITGEPDLDRVISVHSTREYIHAIEGATYEQIEGTGHIGLVTRPNRFRDIVGQFVATHVQADSESPTIPISA